MKAITIPISLGDNYHMTGTATLRMIFTQSDIDFWRSVH